MFDLAWSEIALIAVVAVIVIGPKDLPEAVKGVARMVRKGRQTLAEMRGQADELVREANLHEVRESLHEIRNFNIKDHIEKTVDGDGSIRQTMNEDPLRDWSHDRPATSTAEAKPEASPPSFVPPAPAPLAEAPRPGSPPAFIPPSDAAQHAGPATPAA
jgi:sec-independent protein translocase protein TatB